MNLQSKNEIKNQYDYKKCSKCSKFIPTQGMINKLMMQDPILFILHKTGKIKEHTCIGVKSKNESSL